MTKTRVKKMYRLFSVAIALAMILSLVPLPLMPTNTADAWSTAGGDAKDENALRTTGGSLGTGDIEMANINATTSRAITASYFAGTAPISGAAGTTDVHAAQITYAWIMLRDRTSGRWMQFFVENQGLPDGLTGVPVARNWRAIRTGAFSHLGPGYPGGVQDNRRGVQLAGCVRTDAAVVAPVAADCGSVTPFLGATTAGATPAGSIFTVANAPITDLATAANVAATNFGSINLALPAGQAATIGVANALYSGAGDSALTGGRGAFVSQARITGATNGIETTADGNTLIVRWDVTFVLPQFGGPVELYTGVEAGGIKYYDGWDYYGSRLIGRVPAVGIASAPASAIIGATYSALLEISNPEPNFDGHPDIRASGLTFVNPTAGLWGTVIRYHRVDDPSDPSRDRENTMWQIVDNVLGYKPATRATDDLPIVGTYLEAYGGSYEESGDNLRVTFNVRFKSGTAGTWNAYGWGFDREGNATGLKLIGSVLVQ